MRLSVRIAHAAALVALVLTLFACKKPVEPVTISFMNFRMYESTKLQIQLDSPNPTIGTFVDSSMNVFSNDRGEILLDLVELLGRD